jgi:hypothetical protein
VPTCLSEAENHMPCVEIYGIISGSFEVCVDLHCCNFARMRQRLHGLETYEPLDSVKDGKFID